MQPITHRLTTRRLRTVAIVALAVGTLGLASCSSASGTPSIKSTTSTTKAPHTAQNTSDSTGVNFPAVVDPSPIGNIGTKPTVTVPTGPAPTTMQVSDLITGTGPTVKSGDTVTCAYVGAFYSNGKIFDASWTDGNGGPATFPLSGVIPGWTKGLIGMKVGGRRELVIPPVLAYGANGDGPIGPNQTLIFIVDLVKIS